MKEEVWCRVEGFRGRYEVSNQGRVRRLYKSGVKRVLSLHPNNDGYLRVELYPDGRRVRIQVSHLVLNAFVGPRPEGMETAHLNGDKVDNRPENLAWVSHAENVRHQVVHGTTRRGTLNPNAKLNPAKVREIRRLRAEGVQSKHLAPRFGVCAGTINEVLRRRVWGWVDD